MSKVNVAFQILNDNESAPPTFQEMQCHMVYNVKMEDFRCKARLVVGGHMTDAPASITYASVVSHESVRIALTLVALNGLQVRKVYHGRSEGKRWSVHMTQIKL